MRLLHRVVALGALAGLLGCSLLLDGDDFSSEPTTDAGSPKSGAEGGGSDVTQPDGPDAAAGDSGPGCKPGAHEFCVDFDDGNVATGWTTFASDPARTRLVADGSVSAPNALWLSFDAGEPPISFSRDLSGGFSTLACTIHFRRDLVGDDTLGFATLDVATSQADYRTYLFMGPQNGFLQPEVYPTDGGARAVPDVSGSTALAFEPGVFHAIRIETNGKVFRLLVDGALVQQAPVNVTSAPLSATFRIGVLRDLGRSTPWIVRFDDISCDRF